MLKIDSALYWSRMPASRNEDPPQNLPLGVGICLTAYLFFVTVSSIVWVFQGHFPTVQILFIQNLVSWLCLLPIALRKGVKELKTNFLSDHLLRDLFGVGSYFLYFLAIRDLNLVDATTLNYSSPFFVPVIWWIWMNQKVGGHVWWSIIVGFIGVAVILNPTKEIFQIGFMYGLFAGISSAISFCSLRILNLHREPMRRTLFYYFSFGTLITFPFAWIYWVPPTGIEWVQVISVGVGTAIAQILLTVAYRYGTASYLSPLGYSTVVYAALISWLIFDKSLTIRSLIGTVLIIVGGTLTYILKKKPESIAETFKNPDAK